MKNIRFTLLIVLGALVLWGCASSRESNDEYMKRLNASDDRISSSFHGEHINKIIAQLGSPNQSLDDGQGGKILIFTRQKTTTTPGHSSGYVSGGMWFGSETPAGTTTTYLHMIFYVNKDGIIYNSVNKRE